MYGDDDNLLSMFDTVAHSLVCSVLKISRISSFLCTCSLFRLCSSWVAFILSLRWSKRSINGNTHTTHLPERCCCFYSSFLVVPFHRSPANRWENICCFLASTHTHITIAWYVHFIRLLFGLIFRYENLGEKNIGVLFFVLMIFLSDCVSNLLKHSSKCWDNRHKKGTIAYAMQHWGMCTQAQTRSAEEVEETEEVKKAMMKKNKNWHRLHCNRKYFIHMCLCLCEH